MFKINKIIRFAIVVLCCAFGFTNVAYAYSTVNTEELEIITIGYREEWSPAKDSDETGYKGYGYDYFKELAKYSDHKYDFVNLDLKEGLQMLQNGEIDLLGPVGFIDERAERAEYTTEPFAYDEAFLTTLKDSEIELNDIESINNKSVALLDNSMVLREYVSDYMEENNIQIEYRVHTLVTSLEDGDYDLEATWSYGLSENRQIVARLGRVPLYFVAHKGNTELIEEINAAIEEATAENPYFQLEIAQKYSDDLAMAKPILTEEDKLLLEKKGNEFTVLISPDHEPLEYIDDNGVPSGIAIDIMNAIAQDAGIKFNYVFEAKEGTINYDRVDISVASINSSYTEDLYTETDVWIDFPMMYLGKKSSDIGGVGKIGMLDYNGYTLDNPNVVLYDSIDEMIELLESDVIDFIVSTTVATAYILDETGVEDYSVYATGDEMLIKMMVSNELSDYLGVFNKLIKRLDQDEIQAIVVNHSSNFSPDDSLYDFFMKNPSIFISIILMIILVCTGIFLAMDRSKKLALQKIVNEDKLTGLISSNKFYETAKEIMKTAKPNEYILISLDIDNFQYINEAYGYECGSKVLISLARQLSLNYTKNSLITRERADNFLILTHDNIFPCGNKICEDCLATAIGDSLRGGYKTSLSRGFYKISNTSEIFEYIVDCAHSARVLGKNKYGSTIFAFTEEMRKERETKNIIVTTMEQALIDREFQVFYQPKVELNGCKLTGAEALIRWFPINGRAIYPDNFITLFEKNGFILDLDYFVFEEVCKFISCWREKIVVPMISVNVSGITLLDKNLVDKLSRISSKYKIDNSLMELEITESVVIRDFEDAIASIKLLKEAGFGISLDDFGSGMSSLNRLKDMNVDIIKIDREFLNASLSDAKGVAIVKGIILLAKSLDILTIAEGVETKEHVKFLQELECNYAQGYYFGKAMSEKDFRDVIISGIADN